MVLRLRLLCFFFCSALQAQINVHPVVKNGIDSAIVRNKTLKNKKLDTDIDKLKKESVANLYLPKVELEAAYGYMQGVINLDLPTEVIPLPPPLNPITLFDGFGSFDFNSQFYNASLMAKSVVFSGFQIPNAVRALEKKIEGNQFLIDVGEEQIIQEVITSFDQLMLLKQAEILIANSRKRLDKEQLRVQKAIQLGLGVPYDRDKIVLAKLELQSKNIEVKGKQKVLKSKIAMLTGFSLGVIESISFIPEPAISLREDYTIQNKNELKALQSFTEAQEYLIKKEKGSYLPKVGVSIGLTYAGLFGSQIETEVLPLLDDKLSLDIDNLGLQPIFTAGIGLQWGIFDGLERSHKIKIAKIEKVQLENKLSDAEEKLDLLLTNAQHQYTAEVARLEVAYQQEHVAKNNLVKAQKQYALGLISVTERLASENDYVKAKLHTVESLVNQRTSAVKLYIASGGLQQNIRVK